MRKKISKKILDTSHMYSIEGLSQFLLNEANKDSPDKINPSGRFILKAIDNWIIPYPDKSRPINVFIEIKDFTEVDVPCPTGSVALIDLVIDLKLKMWQEANEPIDKK